MTRRRPGEGTLRLRAGRWQSRARDPRTGKERSRTWPAGTTEAQARKQHATWVQQVAARQVGVRAETLDGTFAAYVDMLEQLRRAPSTIRNAEHVARITLAELDRRTADIDPGKQLMTARKDVGGSMTLAERLATEGPTPELVEAVAELELFVARCRVMNAHVAAFGFRTG